MQKAAGVHIWDRAAIPGCFRMAAGILACLSMKPQHSSVQRKHRFVVVVVAASIVA